MAGWGYALAEQMLQLLQAAPSQDQLGEADGIDVMITPIADDGRGSQRVAQLLLQISIMDG